MSKPLLVEIGTEELPASFVASALESMPRLTQQLLHGARLDAGAMRPLGTPRRLALYVADVADAQPDLSEEVTGPPKSAAFDAKGHPTKAAEGFARKHGVSASELRVVDTPKGEYVAARREEKGKPALEVLPALLEEMFRSIPFPKSMRWGEGEVAFGRPIHWIVALHGEDVLPLRFAGIESGNRSRGHRFLAPGEHVIPHPDRYVDALREAHVLVDPAERRERMLQELRRTASSVGGELVEDAFLMDECLSLVEEPHVVAGGFDARFLELPEEVIVAVMKGHQRYFAVREPGQGALSPTYLTVVNTANDPDTIRLGNDRVLRARLADAEFFVSEDRKWPLSERVEDLDGIVFQAKLGTIGDKVRRLIALQASVSESVALQGGADAAHLCKADLTTHIVGEFPELQGIMGRWYALHDGVDARVADAIRDHYLPKGAGDSVPQDVLSAVVAVADRMDTLTGCFAAGLIPSGSADPYALRRAALGVVRIALEGPLDVDVRDLTERAYDLYHHEGLAPKETLLAEVGRFFEARLKSFYGERHPPDMIEACLCAWDGGSLRDLDRRIHAVEAVRKRPEITSLAVAFKRTFNIAKDVTGEPDPALYDHEEEERLAEAFGALRPELEQAIAKAEYEPALLAVARNLREPIDRFFDHVFVMVDDAAVRDNRLKLLGSIAQTVNRVACFHLLATPE